PERAGEPSTASASSSAVPENAVDPDHAVAAPGKLEGSLYGDDLLVVSDDTISDELLEQITGVTVRGRKGVVAYEMLSYGQFSVENKLFNIAAVDPAGYRNFTGTKSAAFQDQWDRIAGGEVAVMQDLQRRLPIDDDDYLQVGKQQIHVGAWSTAEVDSVDAMVNEKWGAELGLQKDNAIILNTGLSSPQVVRDRIEKAVGKGKVSIIALDIVAQEGLDIGTFQTAVPVGAFREAVGVFRYTPIGGGRIAPDPAWVKRYIVTEQVPILGTVTCNRHMMPQLKAALAEVQRRGLASEIHPDEYAGCYYPRFIAGSTNLSNHSFGLALDFNVPGNQRGTVGEMNREVVAIFKYWGFAWGGDWAWTDPMHFELERIVNPG
ncbi:M15 family metallopeptidase, partial [Nocardioides sp.]